jgi:hypothetical protein
MDIQAGIPRSRGAVCGVLLVLLGLWGGLAPFVGPYIHFGFSPDKAWEYTQGRVYYSAIPGAAALIGGLAVLLTRNRAVGVIGGLLAVLGGAWFGLGDGFVTTVLKKSSISIGAPLAPFASTASTLRTYLETIAFFGGLGLVVLFFGALAIGRFSMLAARDVVPMADDSGYYETQTSFPTTTTGQFPGVEQYPDVPPPGYPTIPASQ